VVTLFYLNLFQDQFVDMSENASFGQDCYLRGEKRNVSGIH